MSEFDRIDAAGAALTVMDEAPEALQVEAEPDGLALEPAAEPDGLALDPEPDGLALEDEAQGDGEPTPDEEAAEPPQGEKGGRMAWRVAQAKRYRAQADRKLEEVTQRAETLDRREAEIADREKLAALMDSDPEEALEKLAQMSGRSGADFYEQLTRRRLGEIDDEQSGATEYRAEIEKVRAEFRAELERRDADERAHINAQGEQRHARAVESLVRDFTAIPDSVEERAEYPHLAAWPKAKIESQARAAIAWGMENAPEMPIPELYAALDKIAREEYILMQRHLGAQGGGPSRENSAQGHGSPATAKPEAAHRAATVSNVTQAANGSSRRALTHEERLAEAANALRGVSL
jgi:hypothetical protein